jgi:hypothetical protein
MTNPNPVIALNWDLTLPRGVTIDTDNLNFTGGRAGGNTHTIGTNKLEENKYRFIVYSPQNREITGNSGDLLSIPIRLDDDLALGEYPVLATAPNLIYVENGIADETAPSCKDGLLTLSDTDYNHINNLENNSLSVYPNPVKRYLYIESDAPVSAVELYSQSGVCVLRDDSFSGKIDAGHLADGFYLVKIYTGESTTTRKIIINK